MVELIGITKRFGDFVAVDGVDLRVAAGEFLTLLGPSGCGKTTLLRMISGFEMPTTGSVHLDGNDVTALPPYRRNVNQVFQSYALFPHLNVESNIGFGLRMKKTPAAEARVRVAKAIEMVGLAGMEKRKSDQLSGGQRQRVALARALVCEPKVLLLDEPLAALDAKLRRAMQLELKRLQQRLGITFIFVTHDQDEALVMSDRIAVVNQGRIEQIGPGREIYTRPATRFVADFLGQTNLLPARVVSRDEGWVELLAMEEIQLRLPANRIEANAERVLLAIRPEKLRLLPAGTSPSPGSFSVTVAENIFRGPTAQLLLRTSAGRELSALVANSNGDCPALAAGDRIVAEISPDDVILLNDSPVGE